MLITVTDTFHEFEDRVFSIATCIKPVIPVYFFKIEVTYEKQMAIFQVNHFTHCIKTQFVLFLLAFTMSVHADA